MVSYDIIGSAKKAVAIIKVPEGANEKELAESIIRMNKNVKSVLKKESEREGDYRLWKLDLILGDEDTEVIHKENGYILKLDPKKVYFSPRESTERQRIASLVKEKETVMVMFAGIGAYAIAIAKKQPNVEKIICIEINPEAVKYMKENCRINKLSHKIIPLEGDVFDLAKNYFGVCDRVIMPLPHSAHKFLDLAKNCLKPEGGIVHLYQISSKKDFSDVISKLEKEKLIENMEIVGKNIVLPYAPGKFKIRIDLKV